MTSAGYGASSDYGTASQGYGGQAGYDQSGYGTQTGYGSAADLGTKAAGALTGYEGSGWVYKAMAPLLWGMRKSLYQ